MADDLSTVQPEVEAEAPTSEVETEGQEAEVNEAPEESEAQENDQPEDEQEQADEEVEYDLGSGQKVKFKASANAKEVFETAQKAFKEAEGSLTRKFQDAAERAKSVEAREKVVEKLHNLNGEALNTFSRGLAVKQEIEQLEKIDVNAMWQSPDPAVRDRARMVSDALSAKRAELQNITGKVSQIEGELTKTQAAEVARRIAEGEATVEKRIPGFKQKHLPDVIEYVSTNYGIPKDVAASAWALNPDTAQMAYKAMLYDRMQAQARSAVKPKPQQPAQPFVPPVRGKGAPATKSPKDMTPAEMARHLGLPGGR